jgi:uncharacterized repeat protein (TIGR01451 family)
MRNHSKRTNSKSSFYRLIAATLTMSGISLLTPILTFAQSVPISNTATSSFESLTGTTFSTISNPAILGGSPSVANAITSCNGNLLVDSAGFSVGLYEPINATGDIGSPVVLTSTAPSQTSANIVVGVSPNIYNANPFFLVTTDQGKYNFLLDINRGQVDVGKEYILVVRPPATSSLAERRIKITITARNASTANYTATSLDGNPISSSGTNSVTGVFNVANTTTAGLSLAVAFSLNVGVCEAQAIQLIKTGDRSAAEPGDIVIYRLAAKNLSSTVVTNPEIRDELPLGFQYVDGSIRAELGGNAVTVKVDRNGRSLTFRPNASLPKAADNLNLNIVYAAQVTNDAIRGTGINRASIAGVRADNQQIVRSGPVSHLLRIRPGILSDCGTLIGRVFVDKNFDGEQQSGEPGVPNAVIYMDDGNRIVTDANGLYSISSVLSGSRTLAIDLTSVPGYTLAPNLYFIERNSQSRLVRLAPGGLGRVNFAVTPVARGIGDAKQVGTK